MRALSAALSLLLLSSLVAAQAEPGPAPAEPGPEEPAPAPKAPAAGEEIRKRGAEDAALLLPQRGLGGDDSGKVEPDKTTLKECKIEVEGCEKMTGYVLTPDTLPEGRKVALMFTFHGNGDLGRGRVQNVGRITTARDPVITIGVQYQELTPEGGGTMGMPTLATQDKIIEGSKWLLKKVMAEQPVDPARVFVSGFSWGTSWASGWARKEWMENPDAFPFRAVFLYSSGGAVSRETCPPVPWINFVGSEETAVLGTINVVASVRHYSNTLAAWGIPVQYHEIPKMGHAVNGRCHQITRDVVNDLGGPGRLPYGTAQEAPEAVTFEASTDALVLELQKLCNEDRW
ncbi:MAG: hypothetical protein IT463_10165, partial [Planctomycetes bacterium]|nr:hypothetical protein [Planctomycetota bacterium]